MKPFDLEKAIAGHKLVTRDGRKVFNFHYFKDIATIYALLETKNKGFFVKTFDKNGFYIAGGVYDDDLFLAPVKKTYWVNVYEGENKAILIGNCHNNEEEANQTAFGPTLKKIKTISFEVEE